MIFNKFGIYLACIAFVYSCASTSEATKTKSSKPKVAVYKKSDPTYLFTKQPGNFYFTILQLNDVYEIAPVQGGKYGGMARVETIKQELVKEDLNTFIMMAGDFLNPSLLGTMKVDGNPVKGKQMIEVMNAMNFDLVAFGNHEFDITYDQLQQRLNESNFEWISANVLHNVNGQAHYFQKVKDGRKLAVNDTYIQEVFINGGSIKVGFISACIPSNPVDYVTYSDVFIELERSYNELKDQTDMVLGLTHLSIDQDIAVAKMLPNVPLIMGGHEHTNNYKTIGNVKIAKADANAKSVYIHRFEYNPLTKETKVKSELRVVDENIPKNLAVANVVNKWQDILITRIKEVIANPNEIIYNAVTPLEGRDTPIRSQQTNLGGLIAESLSYSYTDTVDCAFMNSGSMRLDDVLSGEINAIDVFRVLPFGGQVYKVQLKGSLLKQVLDYSEKEIGTGAYLQTYKITKSGINWNVNNQVIDPEKIYTIATSDYLLKGFDIPILNETNPDVISVYKPQEIELGFDIRKAVVNYLRTK